MVLFNYKIIENDLCVSNGRINFLPRIGEQINVGHIVTIKNIVYDITKSTDGYFDVVLYA